MNETKRFIVDGTSEAMVVRPQREILDLTVAREFSEALDEAAAGAKAVLVDLSGVSYLDSVIISTLVKCYVAQRQEGRRLILFAMQDYVEELLRSTGLLSVMDICHDESSALKLASKPVEEEEVARYGRAEGEEI